MKMSHHPEIRDWVKKEYPGSYSFLMDNFSAYGGVFMVGGAIRYYFLRNRPTFARTRLNDLDVTVDHITTKELRTVPGLTIEEFLPSSSRGLITLDGPLIDIWPLQETSGLEEFNLPITIEGVLMRGVLSLDKVAVDLRDGKTYDLGGLDAILDGRISYCPARPYLEELNAARILIYQHNTGFSLDESSVRHLDHVSAKMTPEKEDELRREVRKKYPELADWVIGKLAERRHRTR